MSRHYCFTSQSIEPEFDESICRYLIYGREHGEKTHKLHYQGYVEFKKPIRIAQAQRVLGLQKQHFEPRKGSRDQAREYCMKEEDYEEFGTWDLKPGKRTDLDTVKDLISQGKGVRHVIEETHSYQAIKYAETCMRYIGKKRFWNTKLIPYDDMPESEDYFYTDGYEWDNYDGQEVVVYTKHITYSCPYVQQFNRKVPFVVGKYKRQFLAKTVWHPRL